MGEGVVGWSARENKPLFLANAQADQRFVVKWEHDRDVAAVMNLPLVDDGTVVGVLQVSTRPGTPAFTREEQRLLASFADQAAVAIKNAQLYEVERRRAQEMALVAEINRTISLSLDLDTTLNSILASIRTLIPYDLSEITLWDEHDKVLRTRGRGADPQYEAIQSRLKRRVSDRSRHFRMAGAHAATAPDSGSRHERSPSQPGCQSIPHPIDLRGPVDRQRSIRRHDRARRR